MIYYKNERLKSQFMKKILFIVTQSEFGGAQRYIFEVATHLDPEKYEILVAAGGGSGELFEKIKSQKHAPYRNEVSGAGSKVKIFPLKHLKRTPFPICLAIKEIYDLLRKEKPDALFLCSTTAGLLGSIASFFYKLKTKNYQLKTIYRIGGWAFRDPRPFWQNKFLLWAEKLTAPLKDKIIVNSETDREIAIKYKICPTEKIVKIYNGIDVEKIEFLSKEGAKILLLEKTRRNFGGERVSASFIVGTVANFYKTKGLPYLIEAAKILTKTYNLKPITYLIIGEGKERKKLVLLIKKYNLENRIFLLGRIPDAYRYLKAFDAFVLPSLKEGFPWIILEAMAAEVPILATNVGAIPEIIEDNVDGFLIEPKNPQIIAGKISWMLEHPKESQEMGIRARKKIEKEYPLQKMIEETEKVLGY